MKLFGSTRSGARLAKNMHAAYDQAPSRKSGSVAVAPRKKNPLKTLAVVLAVVLFAEICYFFVVYTNNGFISKWRSIYI